MVTVNDSYAQLLLGLKVSEATPHDLLDELERRGAYVAATMAMDSLRCWAGGAQGRYVGPHDLKRWMRWAAGKGTY